MTKKHFETLAKCLAFQANLSGWDSKTFDDALHAVGTACTCHNEGFDYSRFRTFAQQALQGLQEARFMQEAENA